MRTSSRSEFGLVETGVISLYDVLPIVDEILNIEQAEFRPGRSTQDQVLALTTYVENGYQRRDKTGETIKSSTLNVIARGTTAISCPRG